MNPQDYIKKPCHERWETMVGDEQQKFCNSCSCSVHNLTGMSHHEIMELHSKNNGKLCGAFHLTVTQSPKTKPRRIHFKKPLIVGMSISSMALAACKPEPIILGEMPATLGKIAPEKPTKP